MSRHITSALLSFVLLSTMALSGCATLSEGECKTADWTTIGRQDGSNGFKRSRLHKHHKACAKYNIAPNNDNYYAGREAGLKSYCTPRNGFTEGRAGNTYRNVCPPNTEARFLAEYRQGKIIHAVDKDIENLENTIDRRENQLDDSDTTEKQADKLRKSLRHNYDKLRSLNNQLIRLERLHANRPHNRH